MKRHGRNLHAYYEMKDDMSKLYDIWKKQNCGERKCISGCQGLSGRKE